MDSDGVRPDIILQRCPNLVKLDFRGSIYNVKWAHELAGFKHQTLSDASLRFYTADFDIQPFLKATPKLRRLCLHMNNPGLGRSLPESIQKYCPELEAFILYIHTDQLDDIDESSPRTFMSGKRISYTDDPKNSTVMGSQQEKQELKGLQYIVFQEEIAHSEASSIILLPLVEKFNNQLISLDLGKSGSVNDNVLSHISELIFPSLKYLTLKGSSPWDVSSVSGLRSIFEHGSVPNLTHIGLHQLDTIVDTVLDAIASSCPHLQNILLDNCQGITTDGMIRFLNRLAGQLRGITIEQSGFALTPEVLECMGTQLQVLEYLTIEAFQYDFLALADVERFLDIRNHEQKKKKNSDRKLMERLDIYFVFDSSSDYPGKACVDRLLEKMDSNAKEWSYTMVMPYEEVQVVLDCGEDVYDQITHVEFRRRKKKKQRVMTDSLAT
ncbi:hypothetical protein INT45_013225 [Circinella minor]|uniref:RNI-like protein n=1 Tax=Circinella minor TaxID=1195481 RepID=A0A8H7RYM4_9FUNG|nr:hypothetical protein INT45_013225 [Circinella minor]